MAGVQLNFVFLYSPSEAMSESRIFEQNKHFLRYCTLFVAVWANGSKIICVIGVELAQWASLWAEMKLRG